MNSSKQGLSASGLAERTVAILEDEQYRGRLKRHTKIGIGALLVGAGGALLSLWLLLRIPLSTQVAHFWLLCLILSAGVFCVAALTLAGALTAHFAMQRIALGNKDVEVFEATREMEELLDQIDTLAALVREVGSRRGVFEYELIEYSLEFIGRRRASQNSSERTKAWETLTERWKAIGASSEKLRGMTTSGGVLG